MYSPDRHNSLQRLNMNSLQRHNLSSLPAINYFNLHYVIILLTLCIKECMSWPEGTYGLPMAQSGCPDSIHVDWHKGSRTQMTEEGSHASDHNHLAGVGATKAQTDNKMVQNFCIKTTHPAEGDYTWQPGRYCIYKKNECPSGFKQGHVYWDDNVPFFGHSDIQHTSGTLPDGKYDKNTDIYFCCRNDGSHTQPIQLPTVSDFYLLQLGQVCQKVSGMIVTEEWVYWAGETILNFDDEGGLYPHLTRTQYPNKYTKLYYCYYTPKKGKSSLQTALYAVYVIAGIVALIVVSFAVMCIVQRCSASKYNETPHNAENSHPVQYTANSYLVSQYNRPPSTEARHYGPEQTRPVSYHRPSSDCHGDSAEFASYRPTSGEFTGFRPTSGEFGNFRPISGDFGNFRPTSGEFGSFPPAIDDNNEHNVLKPNENDMLLPTAPPITPEEHQIPSPPSYDEVIQRPGDSGVVGHRV